MNKGRPLCILSYHEVIVTNVITVMVFSPSQANIMLHNTDTPDPARSVLSMHIILKYMV